MADEAMSGPPDVREFRRNWQDERFKTQWEIPDYTAVIMQAYAAAVLRALGTEVEEAVPGSCPIIGHDEKHCARCLAESWASQLEGK